MRAHTAQLGIGEGQWSRRRLLAFGCLAAAASLAPKPAFAHLRRTTMSEKSLGFYNTHTGESLNTVYWSQGEYLSESLAEINHILRDHRADEVRPIDPELLDLLFAMHRKLEACRPFYIISGYRSLATNDMLRQHRKGVAKHSLHIQGKAVDIRLPGCRLAAVHRAAIALHSGGVGYYPRSDFVHIDTGKIRYWRL